MAAAAPQREPRGSAELCSLWQRQGLRGRRGAVSGQGQVEYKEDKEEVLHQSSAGMEKDSQSCDQSPSLVRDQGAFG